MKKLLVLTLISFFILSCSNDDSDNCESKRSSINQYYDQQIQQAIDNPGPSGVDYEQISLLNEERNNKLEQACN